MNVKEASDVLLNGAYWQYFKEDTPKEVLQKLSDAIDIACVCLGDLNRLSRTLDTMDRLDHQHNESGQETDSEAFREKRIVEGPESCADCLCRVCARNVGCEGHNPELDGGYADCESCENCKVGETIIVDVPGDCPRLAFLPDMNDTGVQNGRES